MQSVDLLNENPNPTEEEIRLGLEGNLCRCTGYHNIVRAVQHAAGHDVPRPRGAGMTATQDAAAARRDRPRPAPQGGPAADHRPHPLDRQHHRCPGCCTSRWCAARSPTPRITSIDTAAAKAAPNVVAVLTGADLADEQGVLHQRLADHARPEDARPPADGRRPGRVRRRDRRRRRRPHAPPRPATPPSWSTSTTTSCRPRSTSRRRPTDDGARPPRPRHQQVARSGSFDSAEAGTGGDVDEAIAKARGRRHRDRAGVPPAAADPGVHGAALGGGRPDRRADHDVVARPRSRTSCGSRWPRPPACPSRRSG